MSTGTSQDQPRWRAGGVAVVTLAALLPTSFAGWLVYQSMRGPAAPARPPKAVALPSAPVSAPGSPPGAKAGGSPSPSTASPTASPGEPLAGKVVVLDPGHNLNNQYHSAEINRLVDVGNGRKECDTTGTSTNGGYPEASFTLDVSRRARDLLTALGAKVRLTQDGDRDFGPCVDERARIGNAARADASVSVHADGSDPGNRGFHVILPATVHQGSADTTTITGPSRSLGTDLRDHFATATGTAFSNYMGNGTGLVVRGDLGGLNLSTVPKVLIECGNMRDAQDAALLTDAGWRQRAARGIADGITAYLEGSGG